MTPLVSAERPGAMRPKLARHARPLIAGVLGAVGVGATFVPALDEVAVEWVALAVLVPLVSWCALPVHVAAARSIRRGRLTAEVLASVGIVAAFAWSVHGLFSEQAMGHLVPVALSAVLAVIAQHVTELAGRDESDDSAPAWLPPLVLVIAAAALAAWWAADGARAGASAAVSVLLVAGPGALMLAVPAALLVGSRRGSQIGVLAAGIDAMQATQRIDTVVLDKEGTVTTGELSVMTVEPVDPEHLRNLRWFAGALAHCSDHPVARAIAKLAPRGRVSNIAVQPDIGLSGSVDRHPVRIGRATWIGIEGTEGLGVQVAVEVDGRALGWITVGDTPRVEARKGVERLGGIGLDPILVSDRPEADTAHLAGLAGIATHHSEMTVDGCVSLVERLQSDGRVVAMVGNHAVNAPALTAADLAISTVGDSPSDGITLADIDVQHVGEAIVLMRSTLSTMLTSRRGAVIGMLVPMPFAAAGLVEPLYAPLVPLACMVGVAVNSSKISRRQRPGL